MIATLAPWFSVAIALGTLAFAIYSNARKSGIDTLSLDEDRMDRLERRVAELERQLDTCRGENEWLRGENIKLRRGGQVGP
jgi:hypothetical protein